MHHNIHCSIVYNSQIIEANSMSIGRGMHKGDMIHIHNQVLLNHKKEQNSAICSNMDGPRDYHAK